MPDRPAATGTSPRSAGRIRLHSARPYAAEAEYHSLRSPGGSSATRNGASVPPRSSRRRSGSAPRARRTRARRGRPAAAARPRRATRCLISRSRPSTRTPTSSNVARRHAAPRARPAGGSRAPTAPTSRRTRPGARSGLPGSHTTTRVAVVIGQLELVLQAREPVVGQVQHPAAVVADEIGSRSGRSEHSRTAREALVGVVDAQAAEHRAEGSDTVSAVSYSVLNVDDIEGAGPGGSGAFRAPGAGVEAFGINWFEIPPGAGGHEHDEARSGQEEVSVVVRGGGHWMIDGERGSRPGRAASSASIPSRTRCAVAGPDGMTFVSVGAPARRLRASRSVLSESSRASCTCCSGSSGNHRTAGRPQPSARVQRPRRRERVPSTPSRG